jgi:hypothetical protein
VLNLSGTRGQQGGRNETVHYPHKRGSPEPLHSPTRPLILHCFKGTRGRWVGFELLAVSPHSTGQPWPSLQQGRDLASSPNRLQTAVQPQGIERVSTHRSRLLLTCSNRILHKGVIVNGEDGILRMGHAIRCAHKILKNWRPN